MYLPHLRKWHCHPDGCSGPRPWSHPWPSLYLTLHIQSFSQSRGQYLQNISSIWSLLRVFFFFLVIFKIMVKYTNRQFSGIIYILIVVQPSLPCNHRTLFILQHWKSVPTKHFVSSFIGGWTLGLLHLLALANNAVENMDVQVSVWVPAVSSFEYIPGSRIAGSCGNYFSNCHTVFHIVAAPFYIPINSAQVFPFLHFLTNTYYFY